MKCHIAVCCVSPLKHAVLKWGQSTRFAWDSPHFKIELAGTHTIPQSGCVIICFADGRIQYIVGVRFIEPDITGLMNQAPTLRHRSLYATHTEKGIKL